MKKINFEETTINLAESMAHCMKKAMEENPVESKNWTPEQIFEKGANYAARHIEITEKRSDD